MARRKSRKRESGIAGTLLILSIFFLLGRNWIAFGALAVFSAAWWLGFERPTTCGVETDGGTPCKLRAYGYLRACHMPSHKQVKSAILRSYLRPGRSNSRIMWARNSDSARTFGARQPAPSGSGSESVKLAHSGLRECVTFLCGVVSAAVAVVALAFQILSFIGLGAV